MRGLHLLVVSFAIACGARALEPEIDDASESETTGPGEATSTTVDVSITDATATGDTATTSADGSTTFDDTGWPDCPGQPESPASIRLVRDGFPQDWPLDITWTCTVTTFEEIVTLDTPFTGVSFGLACPENTEPTPLHVELQAAPALSLPLAEGDEVTLRYVFEGPFWVNTYLRVDRPDVGHVFTLVEGDSMLPPPKFAFAWPFEVTVLADVCPVHEVSCGTAERLGLEVRLDDGTSRRVVDSTYGIFDDPERTQIWVAEATRMHDVQCTDLPREWFRVLLVNTGS